MKGLMTQTTEEVTYVSIGYLVKNFKVAAETVRNYERAGLIPPAHRTSGNHRRYSQEHIDAMKKILPFG